MGGEVDIRACSGGEEWGRWGSNKAITFYKLGACEVPRRELYFLTLSVFPPHLFCRVSSLKLQIT